MGGSQSIDVSIFHQAHGLLIFTMNAMLITPLGVRCLHRVARERSSVAQASTHIAHSHIANSQPVPAFYFPSPACDKRNRDFAESVDFVPSRGNRRNSVTFFVPAQRMTFLNPVYSEYFADPFVWRHGRDYLAIGTGRAEAAGAVSNSEQPSVFPLLRSRDLAQWSSAGHALVRPDASLGDTYWAPEVVQSGERWYLYYSVGYGDRNHHLRVACSDTPLGPYVDAVALTSAAEVPFAIDPHPFRDVDGRWYLFHARDFFDSLDESGREVRPGTALVVSPLHEMTALDGATHTVARARCDWQRFAMERPMYGRVFDWHTLEGPFVVRHDDCYYCLYSGGCWQTDTYGVDYVSARSVLGPWSDDGIESAPRVLRSVPGRVLGPGHCSVVIGPDDTTSCLAYHAWDRDFTARRLCIDELVFTADGPRSPGPTWSEAARSNPGGESQRAAQSQHN
jgi:GH43 family beta-xylosidase